MASQHIEDYDMYDNDMDLLGYYRQRAMEKYAQDIKDTTGKDGDYG